MIKSPEIKSDMVKAPFVTRRDNRQEKQPHTSENANCLKNVPANIKVCIRIRPMLPFEINRGDKTAVFVKDIHKIEIQKNENSRLFNFDYVHSCEASQAEVFEDSKIGHLLDSVLDGFSATILAYGQTGSGKTFTSVKQTHGQGEQEPE